MSDAKELQDRIQAIANKLSGQYTFETKKEGRLIIKELNQGKRELNQIKREANQTMKEIRTVYKERIANAGSSGGALLGLFGKRGAGRSYAANAKRSERDRRDRELEPYNTVKLAIDDLVVQIERAKINVQKEVDSIT